MFAKINFQKAGSLVSITFNKKMKVTFHMVCSIPTSFSSLL